MASYCSVKLRLTIHYGRVIVTVLLPASLPVVSRTKTLKDATAPGVVKPAMV